MEKVAYFWKNTNNKKVLKQELSYVILVPFGGSTTTLIDKL